MLTYDEILNAPLGKLRSAVDDWTTMVGKLKTLSDDMHDTVFKPLRDSGWRGADAKAGITFIQETNLEFQDAVSEATGIRDILEEAHGAIKDQRDRLREITDEEAPAKDVRVDGSGKVTPRSSGPGADVAYKDEVEYIEQEIERARVRATEADEKAAFALEGNVEKGEDFTNPLHESLGEAQAAQSEQRFREAEDFIYEEMMKNIESDSVAQIKTLLREPEWYEFGRNPGQDAIAAMAIWTSKVAPGEEWDHKPILEDRLGLESKREFDLKVPMQDRSVSYDIWSNIHYGYVGTAAGMDEETLIDGASVGEGVGENDKGDQMTMRLGVELHEKYGDDLTKEQLHDAVMKEIRKMEEEGAPQVQEWEPRKY